MEKFHIVRTEENGVITATVVHDEEEVTFVEDIQDVKEMSKKSKK